MLFTFIYLIFSACSKDDTECNVSNVTIEDEPKNTINKIAGVWESLDNDLYFISISPQGKVSYCFSEYTMGIGYGKLYGKELTLDNDYSEYLDKLSVEITNNAMYIKGLIKKKGTNENESIVQSFKKVDERNVYSFIGQFWKPLSGLSPIYGDVQHTLSFVGEHTAQYKFYVVKTGKIIRESLWYYIPRTHHERGNIVYVHKAGEVTPLIQVCNSWININLFD